MLVVPNESLSSLSDDSEWQDGKENNIGDTGDDSPNELSVGVLGEDGDAEGEQEPQWCETCTPFI